MWQHRGYHRQCHPLANPFCRMHCLTWFSRRMPHTQGNVHSGLDSTRLMSVQSQQLITDILIHWMYWSIVCEIHSIYPTAFHRDFEAFRSKAWMFRQYHLLTNPWGPPTLEPGPGTGILDPAVREMILIRCDSCISAEIRRLQGLGSEGHSSVLGA